MRIMTWNLWHHFGPWEQRERAIMATIREQAPDIMCLQEVHTADRQAEQLAEALGFDVAVTVGQWNMGNAIVSRWPIVRSGQVALPNALGEPAHRKALFAVIETPWGQWPVVCTHLDHRFDESNVRRLQVDALSDLVLELRGDPTVDRPVLIGGDFNAVPDSDEIRRLTGRSEVRHRNMVWSDFWEQKGSGDGHTWSDSNEYLAEANWPNRRLDYLFVTWPRPKPIGNPSRVWLAGVDPVDGVQASDHFAIVADVVTMKAESSSD